MNERGVDTERARLSGEAADQVREPDTPGFPTTSEVEPRRPDVAVVEPPVSYYDQPVIKEPVWIWSVPAYFYTGGVAAGAALIGAVAQLVDRQGYARLIRRCRWLAAAGTSAGTGFLIHDLGRPARFLNMLRVFRPSSAMSMGSWALAASSTAAAGSAALPLLGDDAGEILGDVAGLTAGALAPVLGTYTGVLIADTAVPVWQAARGELPVLFGASSLTAAAAALEFGDLDDREERLTRRLGVTAGLADLVAATAVDQAVDEVEEVGRALHDGLAGTLWRASKGLTLAGVVASLLPMPGSWRRARRTLSALAASLGSLLLRFALFQAGKASARDPQATFAQQRRGHGAMEVTGLEPVVSPDAADHLV